MTRKQLLKMIDIAKVEEAIRKAELETSGEIRVSISPFFWGDVRKAGELAFRRLGMHKTEQRNGVLFFVTPSRRKFVVIGDAGIHSKVGDEFWVKVAEAVSFRFREGDFTGGLIDGIEEAGARLAEFFPHAGASDRNELSDSVDIV